VSIEAPLVRGFVDLFWFDFRDESVRDAELDGGTEGLFVCDIEL
jgi:hypothetical protein